VLHLRDVGHLAKALSVTRDSLLSSLEQRHECYQDWLLVDPLGREKARRVVEVNGSIRSLQDAFFNNVLSKRLTPTPYSHGGVRGRSIKTNADAHLASQFVMKVDISRFYPSIANHRVYRLLAQEFRCSPDVSRLCTLLCTYEHHLALGLVTSPILADYILRPVDARLSAACAKAGLTYTRYVDDLTISGPYSLEASGFYELVQDVLRDHGFASNPKKVVFGRLADGITLANVRIVRNHLDVGREYLSLLEAELNALRLLGEGGEYSGQTYATSGQVRGRITFVCWLNPRRRRPLMHRFRSVNWHRVAQEAESRGLIVARKRLVKA